MSSSPSCFHHYF